MGHRIGDVVWLRRDSDLVALRGRVGTNPGKVGDAWMDEGGARISVVYEDEQVLALDVASAAFEAGSRLEHAECHGAGCPPARSIPAVHRPAAPPAQAFTR